MLRENGEQIRMDYRRGKFGEPHERSLNAKGVAPFELDDALEPIQRRDVSKFEPEELRCERGVHICIRPCCSSEQVLAPVHTQRLVSMIMDDARCWLEDGRCACMNHPIRELDIVIPVHIWHLGDTTQTPCQFLRKRHVEPVAIAESELRELIFTPSPEEHEI